MKPDDTQQSTGPNNPLSSQPEAVKRPFYRRRRWIISCIIVLAVLGGILTLLLAKSTSQSKNSTQTTKTTTKKTSQSNTQSSVAPTNQWSGSVDKTSIPLGDGRVATAPAVGNIYSCSTNFTGGGARHAGNWINDANNTWDETTKVAVSGEVYWSTASYSESENGESRVITTNDLPLTYATGTFPIGRSDPAYQYDTNPNNINGQSLTYSIPHSPASAASPSCLPLGPIGVLNDGVVLFDALDAGGRDAVAHETQDTCDGHPNGQKMYHYHNVPSCILNTASGVSTLVGYAFDGYGIYVERDDKGNLPTNADLDACHGRTSQVMWNGQLTSIYHYDATVEYPYTLGCFHGTATVSKAR